jgi:HK97 family phage prohead protease
MEFLSIPFEVKDMDEKKGIYTGYFSTFNVKDAGGDTVMPGAFTKTFAEWGPAGKHRIKNLYQHDLFSPVGKPLVLAEDSRGAYHETQISQTTLGKDIMILIRDGVLEEHSFGYATVKADPDPKGGRILRELKCYEYSILLLGMNEQTPVTGIKALSSAGDLQKRMQTVERILRKGELQHDDLVVALELELKQWSEAVKELDVAAAPHGREVIHVNTEKKAFAQRLAEESVFSEFWLYNDVLRWEIMKAMREGTDSNAIKEQVSQDIEEYKATILGWVDRSLASGYFGQKGMEQLLQAGIEFEKKNPITDLIVKQLGMNVPKMEVKINPQPNDPPSNPAPSEEDEVVLAIKALVSDLKPDNHLSAGGAASNQTDPEVIQSVKDLLNQLQNGRVT